MRTKHVTVFFNAILFDTHFDATVMTGNMQLFYLVSAQNSNFFPTIFLSRLINALSYALTDIFKFSAIKIWESVPPEFKRFPYMLFKKRYKRFLLSTQN